MARLSRIVIPGVPHHVTQRGNRRQPIFFSDANRLLYLDLLREGCAPLAAETWIAAQEAGLDRKLAPAKRGRSQGRRWTAGN